MTKKEEKKKEIKVDYFRVEGYPYSITFTPNGNSTHYQILNEQTTRVIAKGEIK
jgi:hypothetical protein